MLVARRLIIVLCAALLAVQVVRNAAVGGLAGAIPEQAARFWPSHPVVQTQLAMVEIAAATGKRQTIPQDAFDALRTSAQKAPLLAEPYLVRGVEAQLTHNEPLARAAFSAAEQRDPRSLAAHYFLAEHDLRNGNAAHGLSELAVLAILAPDGAASVAPFIASYARNRRNWPQVKALFLRNPNLRGATLVRLAADPANAETIVALTDRGARGADAAWLAPLLDSMIAAGDYAKARALWAGSADVAVSPEELPFDRTFSNPKPPAPFNWALVSSSIGLSERRPGGNLHAIFYGQQDGLLARQLLVLKPGNYRLSMRVGGDPGRVSALNWSVRCDKASAAIAAIDLATAARRPLTFAVPSSCPAVWLELNGVAEAISQQVEVTISDLRISRAGSGG